MPKIALKPPLALLAAFSFSLFSFAQSNPLVGVFGHNFSSKKNTPVWTVKEGKVDFQLHFHGDGSVTSVKTSSLDDRKKFWAAMWWSSDTYANARCLGNSAEILCFVPKADRLREPGLRDLGSDFFHYDRIGGVMEVNRISD